MSKRKTLTIYALSLPVLVLFFTNMGGRLPGDLKEPPKVGLEPQEIADEIQMITEKIESGEYGEEGAEVMKVHVNKMASFLSKEIKAKRCSDIREYLPKLYAGKYVIWSTPEGEVVYCQSSVALINKAYEEIRGRKPNDNGLSKWLGVIGLQGHLAAIAGIAEVKQSKENPLSDSELVEALFRVFLDEQPSSQAINQWVNHLKNVGLSQLVNDLGTTPEALKNYSSFFHGIKGNVSKIKVRSGKLEFKGWACFSHSSAPVTVEIYSVDRKRHTRKKFIGKVTTSRASSDGVNNACGTQGQKHHFKLRISQRDFKQRSRVARFYAVDEFNGGKVLLNPNKEIHIHEYRRDDDD